MQFFWITTTLYHTAWKTANGTWNFHLLSEVYFVEYWMLFLTVCLSHHVFTMLSLRWQTIDFCNIHLLNYIAINWFSNNHRDDRVMDCSVTFTSLRMSQLKCGTCGILIIVSDTSEFENPILQLYCGTVTVTNCLSRLILLLTLIGCQASRKPTLPNQPERHQRNESREWS